MKRYTIIFLFILSAAGLSLISPLSGHQDHLFTLRKEIAAEERQIRDFKKKMKKLGDNLKAHKAAHQRRLSSGRKTIEGIKKDMVTLKRERLKVIIDINNEKSEIKEYQKNSTALKKILFQLFVRKKLNAAKAFPAHRDERRRFLNRLSSDAENGYVSPEELYSRYATGLYRDILRGFDSEVYLLNGYKYLRIGWVFLARYNPRTGESGILTRKKGSWDWNVSRDSAFRRSVEGAIKMVEGKEAPDLVDFPVPLSLVESIMKEAGK